MTFLPNAQLAQFLTSTEGAEWLTKARELTLKPNTLLADLKTLRLALSPVQAAAVVEQVLLRRKGTTKFIRAEQMLFIREALEQATHSLVAEHRANRFRGTRLVIDLGCSIGGDSLPLAKVADCVLGVDLDEVRLKFARHNAAVYNLADKVAFLQADIGYLPALSSQFDAFFADPARRTTQGKRTFNPRSYHPPLDKLMETYAHHPLGVKVAPGLDFSAFPFGDEVEVISLAGAAKEATLWCNDLATPGVSRRATLLPGGETLTDSHPNNCPFGSVETYLYEPDPAIIRAGLVKQAGAHLNLHQLDRNIAYLSSRDLVRSPFVKAYQIEAKLPLKLKPINRYLKQHQISRINVKQRGTGLAPNIIANKLKPAKDGAKDGMERTLILIRIAADHLALICQRL